MNCMRGRQSMVGGSPASLGTLINDLEFGFRERAHLFSAIRDRARDRLDLVVISASWRVVSGQVVLNLVSRFLIVNSGEKVGLQRPT